MEIMDDIKLRIEGKDFIISVHELIDSDICESIDEAISHVKKRSGF